MNDDPGLSARLGFTAGALDRMPAQRTDATFLTAETERGDRRFVVFSGDAPLVTTDGGCFFTPETAEALGIAADELYLGRQDGAPIFARRIELEPDSGEASHGTLADLRTLAIEGQIEVSGVALLGLAKSLLSWHRRHGFCANCGERTAPVHGGWRRDCPSCNAEHFPRVDPVAIMLVTEGDRCLLGRQPRFATGSYSCLAGFIEPGETAENAVRREVKEEAGVTVGAVRFLASQPWPFPHSLMIGCHGEALSTDITIDRDELEDARWFTREELRQMIAGTHAGGLRIPPPISIASGMLRHWAGAG
ncbi:NADH pyrophosphatase [Agaricicola taiwanensis]|uniref:NAD(+) diphosphatase n=1 Tax=Agaricicola taiwanensis TaxID=591372 RepID=A0A8J2YFM9_9RHOB|nr:NAD(+) diphosphatase [Agaricicola taiwanensis]GGE33363.1 NADH pyrophosphatase [Agaricicola taiwanensis]